MKNGVLGKVIQYQYLVAEKDNFFVYVMEMETCHRAETQKNGI